MLLVANKSSAIGFTASPSILNMPCLVPIQAVPGILPAEPAFHCEDSDARVTLVRISTPSGDTVNHLPFVKILTQPFVPSRMEITSSARCVVVQTQVN